MNAPDRRVLPDRRADVQDWLESVDRRHNEGRRYLDCEQDLRSDAEKADDDACERADYANKSAREAA